MRRIAVSLLSIALTGLSACATGSPGQPMASAPPARLPGFQVCMEYINIQARFNVATERAQEKLTTAWDPAEVANAKLGIKQQVAVMRDDFLKLASVSDDLGLRNSLEVLATDLERDGLTDLPDTPATQTLTRLCGSAKIPSRSPMPSITPEPDVCHTLSGISVQWPAMQTALQAAVGVKDPILRKLHLDEAKSRLKNIISITEGALAKAKSEAMKVHVQEVLSGLRQFQGRIEEAAASKAAFEQIYQSTGIAERLGQISLICQRSGT